MTPREPRRDPFGSYLLRSGSILEARGETPLSCRFRRNSVRALRWPVGRLRGETQALLALLRPQAAQLLLLLDTQLPKLRAIEMTSLLRAGLPLLNPQLADLARLLRLQLTRLRAVELGRRHGRLGRGLPPLLRRARRGRGVLRDRPAAARPRLRHTRRMNRARCMTRARRRNMRRRKVGRPCRRGNARRGCGARGRHRALRWSGPWWCAGVRRRGHARWRADVRRRRGARCRRGMRDRAGPTPARASLVFPGLCGSLELHQGRQQQRKRRDRGADHHGRCPQDNSPR